LIPTLPHDRMEFGFLLFLLCAYIRCISGVAFGAIGTNRLGGDGMELVIDTPFFPCMRVLCGWHFCLLHIYHYSSLPM
jgi:hypothetical protein